MAGQAAITSLSVTLAASKRAKPIEKPLKRRKKSENNLPVSSLSSLSNVSKLTRKKKSKNNVDTVEDSADFIIKQHEVRQHVLHAISENKIFLCYGYPLIAAALTQRGWVQKNKASGTKSVASHDWLKTHDLERFPSPEALEAWIERTLQHTVPSFIWGFRSRIKWKTLYPHQIVSVHPRAYFTTKDGLLQCLSRLHWYSESGNASVLAPRCYRLRDVEERIVFISDYRLTACMGILKWIVGTFDESGWEGVMDEKGTVESSIIEFAIQRINRYIQERRHKDLDHLQYPYTRAQLWENVMRQFNELLFYKGKIKSMAKGDAQILYEASKKSLQRLAPYWNLNIDGTHNVWIFKPARRSNGVGLMVTNSLDEIIEMDNRMKAKYEHVVVQKYVERPLLIYNTKFDIRQWFLVSDWNPLTIWTYRESYIRFSTQPFTTENFNRSIHLCNNSVQRQFQVSKFRDPNLPDDNMWDHYTFQAYLKTLDEEDAWESLIYPGMKQAILGVMLAFQEDTVVRKNCFEIYGADFILDEELNPWLLEINSGPTMAQSTSVTERMCRQFQEDIIKLMIDRREDPDADIGMFELAYQHLRPFKNILNSPNILVKGKRLKLKKRSEAEASLSSSNETLGVVSTYSISEPDESNTEETVMPPVTPPTKGVAFHDLVSRFNLKDIRETGHRRFQHGHTPTLPEAAPTAMSLVTLLSDDDDDNADDDDNDADNATDELTDYDDSPSILGTSSQTELDAENGEPKTVSFKDKEESTVPAEGEIVVFPPPELVKAASSNDETMSRSVSVGPSISDIPPSISVNFCSKSLNTMPIANKHPQLPLPPKIQMLPNSKAAPRNRVTQISPNKALPRPQPAAKTPSVVSHHQQRARLVQSLPAVRRVQPPPPPSPAPMPIYVRQKPNPKWLYDALDPKLSRLNVNWQNNRGTMSNPSGSGRQTQARRRQNNVLELKDIIPKLASYQHAQMRKQNLPAHFREYLHFWDKLH